jgi:hypothetical protein
MRLATIIEQRLITTSAPLQECWQKAEALHRSLKPEDMSADESDSETEYSVVSQRWRSLELREFYDSVDAHYSNRYINGGRKPGNLARVRKQKYKWTEAWPRNGTAGNLVDPLWKLGMPTAALTLMNLGDDFEVPRLPVSYVVPWPVSTFF